MKNYIVTNACKPEVHVTVNKSRLREYGNKRNVYLGNKTEFELELFNPTTEKIMCKISIDGEFISEGGIILRPAERVFLDRWITKPTKFMFSTYDVKNDSQTKKLISKNGNIDVHFFNELHLPVYTTMIYYDNTSIPSYPFDVRTTIGTIGTGGMFNNNISNTYSNINADSVIVSDTTTKNDIDVKLICEDKKMETGTIESGSESTQKLESSFEIFENFSFHDESIKILPESQKGIHVNEMRSYCTNCRCRIRSSSWKYCPKCGEKL